MLSFELQEKVLAFAYSDMPIRELEEWLLPRLAYLLCDVNSDDADVLAAIELGLADIEAQTITLQEFRDDLKNVLDKHSFVIHMQDDPMPCSMVVIGSSSALTFSPQLQFNDWAGCFAQVS